MATEKQIEANRANAQKSTGPTTEAGKALSSQNSLKHGLTGGSALLVTEDPEEYAAFQQAAVERFKPTSPYAALLVTRLADSLWRLKRIPKLEVYIMEYCYGSEPGGTTDALQELSTEQQLGRALRQWVIPGDAFGKLSRYEAAIMKQVQAITKLLEDLPEPKPAKGSVAAPAPPAKVIDASDIQMQIEASLR